MEKKEREGTPEPVQGRKHQGVDCIYQENAILKPIELWDKPEEMTKQEQTSFYIDRPPTPRFIPTKVGIDVYTQIGDGELFDFESEVEPILQVLVGKTLEHARMEVLEESELSMMREHQQEFERMRDSELMEAQRMEAEEKRRSDESDRRKTEAKIALDQKKIAHQKYVSRVLSKAYLSNLKDKTFKMLRSQGVFRDEGERRILGDVSQSIESNTVN